MIVLREGKAYELTSDELLAAYREQELLFDIDDVKSALECEADTWSWPTSDEDEPRIAAANAILANKSAVEAIARQKRHNEDHYGMNWNDALNDAVKDAINEQMEKMDNE